MREDFRFVHISDIHSKPAHKLEQHRVFEELKDDLQERARKGWRPDLVLVTGDLAYRAAPEEYQQVGEHLGDLADSLGLAREKIVICPGNHDLARSENPILRYR